MKDRILLFLRVYFFWVAYFEVSRILFLIYHLDKSSHLSLKETGTILLLGLRMDAAMAGYWSILTGLLLTASVLWTSKSLRITQLIITLFLLIMSSLIIVGDLELYKHWGFRMDATPLMYLGSEGAGSVSAGVVITLSSLFVLLFSLSLWVFCKFIYPHFYPLKRISAKWSVVLLAISGLLFIPIRSSFSVAPLNTGVVYFHKTNAFANHSGINVVWNFFRSISSTGKALYPNGFYSPEEAPQLLAQMTKTEGANLNIINQEKPNILFIILESFTSKIIEPLGGKAGITPHINALVKEGILFDHFYASGDRTDKGLVALLSSYPAQPRTSIIKFPEKTQSLPFLSRELDKQGYHTSFVYGGDIGFANMESYLTMAGFSHITEDSDFPGELNNSKWGVHDHIVFDRLLSECDSAASPFFKTLLTLSSHEPFDVPTHPRYIEGNDEASLFLNACRYTDASLGEFIRQAKTKPWWNNTLIVITADHGHRFPDQEELKEKERFHTPLLLLGGALAKKDTVIHTIGSQVDIGTTLLKQVSNSPTPFPYGKNLFAGDVHPFAVYIFHNGFGYIDPKNEFIYDFDYKNYIKQAGADSEKKWGEAYMQSLFTDYNKR